MFNIGNINTITFKGNNLPQVNESKIARIAEEAKNFEEKLTTLGKDEFVKRHNEIKNEKFDLSCRANYAVEINTPQDDVFGTPNRRYDYLLIKAKKYQTQDAFNEVLKEETSKFDDKLAEKKENVARELQEINLLECDREVTIINNTNGRMNNKLEVLNNIFEDSQELDPRFQELKKELEANGEF